MIGFSIKTKNIENLTTAIFWFSFEVLRLTEEKFYILYLSMFRSFINVYERDDFLMIDL